MNYKGKGLTLQEAERSKSEHGTNALAREKTKGFFKRFVENLNDPIIKVLLFALVIELVFTFGNCNLFEVVGIVLAILIATFVSTLSEIGSEKAFLKMQADGNTFVRVLRDGVLTELSADELVVGDIVFLSAGERIQADGVLIDGEVKVDQSALNGESIEVSKRVQNKPVSTELSDEGTVFRGSIIVGGSAVMRVCRVGASTFYGIVAKDVQTETRDSPLKIRLAGFAKQISRLGYFMAAIVAITYLFNTFVSDNGFIIEKIAASFRNIPFLISTLTHALTLMITVVVVAAPEGLPMMITVVLSANMKRMVKDGVLVKKLVGIETAGSLNILFTDKTGTLTTGKAECDRIVTVDGAYKSIANLKKYPIIFDLILKTATLNNDATISAGKIVGGNGTDRALLAYFKNEKVESVPIKDSLPFTSERKLSRVTIEKGITLTKGAPEVILEGTKLAMNSDGETVPLDIGRVREEYKRAAEEGNRVIAMSFSRSVDEGEIFLALVILKDKVRRGVKEAVKEVRKAGVQVVMLTGDGRDTAASIAAECGILDIGGKGVIITSSELAGMSDGEVKELLPNLRVLARALPQDKTRLVRLSQEMNLVVGMTGDGINDAPSLKLCDVGFAMGSGAEIAKSAGDVILIDDSFFSINKTILYGRTIFKSIRKFITFQLIMNITACGVSLVGQFLGIDSPITIIQMLWVNIIMDTLGGLAFSGEPPLDYYMKEKPKRRDEGILSSAMLNQIFLTGAYTLFVCILFLRSAVIRSAFSDEASYMSAFYALFIFAGIFNCFGSRCERMWIFRGISKNKPFVFIMMLISVIQIIMIYFGGSLFRTVPLSASELLLVILIAASVIPFETVRRIICKLKPN